MQYSSADGFTVQAVLKNLPQTREWCRISRQKIGAFKGMPECPSVRFTELAFIRHKNTDWFALFGQEQEIKGSGLTSPGDYCIAFLPATHINPFHRKSLVSEDARTDDDTPRPGKHSPLRVAVKPVVEEKLKAVLDDRTSSALLVLFTKKGPVFSGRDEMKEKANRLSEAYRERRPVGRNTTAHTRAESLIDTLFLILQAPSQA